MKLVLSRKGFDSANGGMPSPIFPDGRLVSLPIPVECSQTRIRDLIVPGFDLAKVVSDLSHGRIQGGRHVHLDPDIDPGLLRTRPSYWRGAFGQAASAQRHLKNQGVGKVDLFLFFGWFREVEKEAGEWRYRRHSPNLHVIFGWLVIEDMIPISGNESAILKEHPWLQGHPHLHEFNEKRNTIYIGSDSLPPEIGNNKAGFGAFKEIGNERILTDSSQNNRSVWKLPACFHPTESKPALSYHSNLNRWTKLSNEWTGLKSVGRGQEFVIDAAYYPEIFTWLKNLFK